MIVALMAGLVLFLPESAHATPLASQVREDMIVGVWKTVLSIVNIFAILALIMMAIVNILRINIEAYNFRRLLPALILGIVLANFSHLICQFLIDFAQILTNFFIQPNPVFKQAIDGYTVAQAFGISPNSGNSAVGPALAGSGGLVALLGGYIFASVVSGGFLIFVLLGIIIVFLPSVLALFLALLMYVRLYIIWFLVIMSPVAFFGLIFEPLKGIWTFWWGWFSKWLFLAPIGFFFLRLAVEVSTLAAKATPSTASPTDSAAIGKFGAWIFGLGMVFLAAYVPFSWGQNVFGALKGAIMRAGSMGWRAGNFTKRAVGKQLMDRHKQSAANGNPNTRYKLGQWLSKDFGKAWETYKGEVDKNTMSATMSGGLTRHLASAGNRDKFSAPDIEAYVKAAAGKNSDKSAAGLEAMYRGQQVSDIEGLYQVGNAEAMKKHFELSDMRDRMMGFALQGDHVAEEWIKNQYAGVNRSSLSGEDAEFYDRYASQIQEISHRHVEQRQGERHAEGPENAAVRQTDDNAELHLRMNAAQLSVDQSDISNALSQLSAGNLAGAKAQAKLLFKVTPEAEIDAMSPQQLAEQLHERMNSNQIVGAMRGAGRAPQEIREHVRVRAYQDYEVEQMAQKAGRLSIPGASSTARATEFAGRLRGTSGTAPEQQAARSAVIPHINRVLEQVPQYQTSDQAIAQHLGITLPKPGKKLPQAQQAAIEAERATREAAKTTAINDVINNQADQIASVAENYRSHGQFDRLNTSNITNRNDIANRMNTHIP